MAVGLMDWVRRALAGQSVSEGVPIAPGEEEIAGLNFQSAIDAHMKWKIRLDAVVAGTSTEKLDAATVERDDQCVLGKWIHGPGGEAHSRLNSFSELREVHAQFHRCAANVLVHATSGRQSDARNLLEQGDYARASARVKAILAKLYLDIRG